jgi:hypothetical protein
MCNFRPPLTDVANCSTDNDIEQDTDFRGAHAAAICGSREPDVSCYLLPATVWCYTFGLENAMRWPCMDQGLELHHPSPVATAMNGGIALVRSYRLHNRGNYYRTITL